MTMPDEELLRSRSKKRARARWYHGGTGGGVAQWLPSADGVLPTIWADFTSTDAYWQNNAPTSLASLVSITRASAATQDDSSGVWHQFGSGVLRKTDKGLLIEEARTNSIRNNTMVGAVAGSPGTLPTNWTASGFSGLTQTVVGTGTMNGVDFVDIRFNGTTSGTTGQILFESSTQITAATADVWSMATFMLIVAGSLTNVTSITQTVLENTNVGGLVQTDNGTNRASTVPAAFARFTDTFTLSGGATVARIQPLVAFTLTNTAAVDFTIRIGWPQLEGSSVSFSSSPIPTTNAAVTRAADVVTIATMPSIGAAVTLFGQGIPLAPAAYASNQSVMELDDGTTTNRIFIFRASATALATNIISSGAGPGAGAAWTQNVSGKLAIAVTSGDQAQTFNGAAVTTSATAGFPAGMNNLAIGQRTSGLQWNGYISKIGLWATNRISNASIIALTT